MKKMMKLMVVGSLISISALYGADVVDINAESSDAKRIAKEDLGNKKVVTEEALGLRKTDLYGEDKVVGDKTDYSRPAPGASTKFERAFVNAPPMIPHSVEGMLPITTKNNMCVGCHSPATAKAMGATPLPVSHFTSYRPKTMVAEDGKLIKEGKAVDNTSDVLTASHKLDTLSQARFNCSQCHAPQSKGGTVVGNTFQGDFKDPSAKTGSTLADVMNEGVE